MSSTLPPFYLQWLAEPLAFDAPALDCLGDCERLSSRVDDSKRFLEATKCCTHFPFMANFAVGAMLAKGGAVRARTQMAMALGLVTPLGIFPTLAREVRKQELGPDSFGRALELACPLYDPTVRGCGVWEFRPGVCATYFCVDSGSERLALEKRLNLFEWTLAHEVLWRRGFVQKEIDAMETARTVGQGLEASWLEHVDRKEAFFIECARVANDVTPGEIAELMGEA